MPRFFVDSESINGNIITLNANDSKHIKTVLRSKIGEKVTVCDKNGLDYLCELVSLNSEVTAKIINKTENISEPKTKITLFQGLPKADKMELIIQKSVELGINSIVPIKTSRTIVKLENNADKKLQRWQKISEAAAKQSERGKIPKIENILNFKEAIKYAILNFDDVIIAYENEHKNRIREFISNFSGKSIAVFVGAEGGFEEDEIEYAKENNVKIITLGNRILRTETAGFTILTILLYELE